MGDWLIRRFVKHYHDVQNPAVRADYGQLAGAAGMACNVLLVGIKAAVGLYSGSVAIMADAANNFSDALSSFVTLMGFKLAGKPADEEHPFGHARFEYIAGFVVAVLVFVIGVELMRSGIEKIISPASVRFGIASFISLLVSVLLKIWMAVFNRRIGRKIQSATLEATYADSRNDAIATTAVLLAVAVEVFTGFNLDGWMAVAVAGFILYSGVGIIRKTLNPLLGEAPSQELVQYVSQKISASEGVLGTHDLMVHDYGPGRKFASAHVEMCAQMDALEAHDIIDDIERDFLKKDGIHLVLHYDPITTGDEALDDARTWVEQQVKTIDERLTVHDLRVVDGPVHTNYIFDVVVPAGFKLSATALQCLINNAVQRGEKPIHTVVTVDTSYAPVQK